MLKALVAALLSTASVQQAPGPCLTQAEAIDLSIFMLPAAVDGIAEKCAGALPPGAFLRGEHRAFSERLREQRASRWPNVRQAMSKMGDSELPEGLGDEALMKITEVTVGALVTQDVRAQDCTAADELIRAVEPLPTENIGTIVAVLMELGSKDEDDSGFRVCARTKS